MNKRTKDQIRFDRERIVGYVRDSDRPWTSAPAWATPQDVVALVKAGTLEKDVVALVKAGTLEKQQYVWWGRCRATRLRAYYKLPDAIE